MSFSPEYIKNNLTIILQGPLDKKNIHTVANHCKHWRDIFPIAEIILSISTTDCFSFENKFKNSQIMKKIKMKKNCHDSTRNAINSIHSACDYIVYNENSLATPFPPIKEDTTQFNNINYLIESSNTGLSIASKKFCLRIRNDALFLDSDFINLYCKKYNLPRHKETSALEQRVMVSWNYTLNPFSDERLPLHISDWLHFGLTQDIQTIWDVPLYSYEDSIYYLLHEKKNTTPLESQFYLRIAVEQHVHFHALKKFFPSLKIDYFNDIQSRRLSLDILIDNFFVFSKKDFKFIIRNGHQNNFTSSQGRSHCITEEAWEFITLNRNVDYENLLSGNVDENIKYYSNGNFPIEIPKKEFSPYHGRETLYKKAVFFFFSRILSNRMQEKFFRSPKLFFSDSKFFLVRIIGKIYIKR